MRRLALLLLIAFSLHAQTERDPLLSRIGTRYACALVYSHYPTGRPRLVVAGVDPGSFEDRGEIAARKNGSLVSMDGGEATSYALNMVQERGRLMIEPGDQVYVGMIVGENARENDIPVNPVKEKRLTNMRSQGDGKGIQLNSPLKLSLERALEYIDVDEYVEATPKNLRLRKKVLDENARKRSEKSRALKFVEE